MSQPQSSWDQMHYLGEGEEAIPDDDDWLDNIALFTGISQAPYREENLKGIQVHVSPKTLPLVLPVISKLDQQSHQVIHFLRTLEVPPDLGTSQARRHFIQKASHFFIQKDKLFKHNGRQPPLLVILEERR